MGNVKLSGAKGEFYVGANKVLGVSNYDLNIEMGEVDATDHSTAGWSKTLETMARWSGSITAWYVGDTVTGVAETGQAAIMDACVTGTVIACKFKPLGTGSGKAELSGNALVTAYKLGAPSSGAQPINFDFAGMGALSRGTAAVVGISNGFLLENGTDYLVLENGTDYLILEA